MAEITKIERPKTTSGLTYKKVTGCGNMYVTVAGVNESRKPIEVFSRLGKSGGCSRCQNEALARCISLGLRYGIPPKEFIKQLKDLRCSSPYMWPEQERTLSCADAVGKTLEEYCSGEENT